jgi:hypothetical protein
MFDSYWADQLYGDPADEVRHTEAATSIESFRDIKPHVPLSMVDLTNDSDDEDAQHVQP